MYLVLGSSVLGPSAPGMSHQCWAESRTCQKHSSSCSSEWCCPSSPEGHIAGSCSAGCSLEPSSSSLQSCFPASYSPVFALIEFTAVKMQDLLYSFAELMGFLLPHSPSLSKSLWMITNLPLLPNLCHLWNFKKEKIHAHRVSSNHIERFSSKRIPVFSQ